MHMYKNILNYIYIWGITELTQLSTKSTLLPPIPPILLNWLNPLGFANKIAKSIKNYKKVYFDVGAWKHDVFNYQTHDHNCFYNKWNCQHALLLITFMYKVVVLNDRFKELHHRKRKEKSKKGEKKKVEKKKKYNRNWHKEEINK